MFKATHLKYIYHTYIRSHSRHDLSRSEYVSLPMWELNRFSPMQFIPIYSEQAISKLLRSLSLDISIFLGIKIKETKYVAAIMEDGRDQAEAGAGG